MKLIGIQGNYDAIFSLGNACLVSNRLREYRLRFYTGVIDWMIFLNISQVVDLLQDQFKDFMKKENVIWDGYDAYTITLLLDKKVWDQLLKNITYNEDI